MLVSHPAVAKGSSTPTYFEEFYNRSVRDMMGAFSTLLQMLKKADTHITCRI